MQRSTGNGLSARYTTQAAGPRRERKDLTVVSTKRPLPNDFIKSYALVQTPSFLQSGGSKNPE